MDMNIEDLQRKLEEFGMLSNDKKVFNDNIPLDKKYIFADDKNAIVVSDSNKEYFRLARNIAIEIALLILSKYEKNLKLN